MSARPLLLSFTAQRVSLAIAVAFGLACSSVQFAAAQSDNVRASATEAMLTLPDAPGAVMTSSSAPSGEESVSGDGSFDPKTTPPSTDPLKPWVKLVPTGMIAPPQTASDKFILGIRESVTPFSALGWLFSAGYAHVINGSPNYGTNSTAFAQRFGASVALGVSKEIFSDAVMAPILHQDPRYYQMGKGNSFVKRGFYAATRTVVGKTSSGRTIPNFAYIIGTAGAAALTKTYYPPPNLSTGQVFSTFGTSLGGTALGYLVSEFGGEVIRMLHLTKQE